MATAKNVGASGDPLTEKEDRAEARPTSGDREESMTESGKDSFGRGSGITDPNSTAEGDRSSDEEDPTRVGRAGDTPAGPGNQSPASSGTTSLAGEKRDSDSLKGPGGVEGTE